MCLVDGCGKDAGLTCGNISSISRIRCERHSAAGLASCTQPPMWGRAPDDPIAAGGCRKFIPLQHPSYQSVVVSLVEVGLKQKQPTNLFTMSGMSTSAIMADDLELTREQARWIISSGVFNRLFGQTPFFALEKKHFARLSLTLYARKAEPGRECGPPPPPTPANTGTDRLESSAWSKNWLVVAS
jgi:hypothetical protein